jgi:hypothetical protein
VWFDLTCIRRYKLGSITLDFFSNLCLYIPFWPLFLPTNFRSKHRFKSLGQDRPHYFQTCSCICTFCSEGFCLWKSIEKKITISLYFIKCDSRNLHSTIYMELWPWKREHSVKENNSQRQYVRKIRDYFCVTEIAQWCG